MQTVYNIGTTALDMSTPSTIIGVRDRINQIYDIVNSINITTININSTVNDIEYIVGVINSTTFDTRSRTLVTLVVS